MDDDRRVVLLKNGNVEQSFGRRFAVSYENRSGFVKLKKFCRTDPALIDATRCDEEAQRLFVKQQTEVASRTRRPATSVNLMNKGHKIQPFWFHHGLKIPLASQVQPLLDPSRSLISNTVNPAWDGWLTNFRSYNMVAAMLSLLLLNSAGAGQSGDVARMAYKSGYSVVMPRPFIKRNQKIGPVFIGVDNDRIYIVTATELSPPDFASMNLARDHGTEAYQRWLDSYAVTFTMEAKTQRFFSSFRLERSVETDPALADPPMQDQGYPPVSENSGTV